MRCCLDTSAYCQFKRGDSQVVDLLDRADWIGVPAVVLGELWLGFLLGGRLGRHQTELAAFLAHAVVETLIVDADVARVVCVVVAVARVLLVLHCLHAVG